MTLETDLALEAAELWSSQGGNAGKLQGVESHTRSYNGFTVTEVNVLTEHGAEQIGKPVGQYLTLSIGARERQSAGHFHRAADAVGALLRELLPQGGTNRAALVVGLGNRAITPDAVGPWAVDSTVVTRHLIEHVPDCFSGFRPVAAVATGVLGTTGIESGELVKALCERIQPAVVIAVDALAARSVDRLCTTIQLADTGIIPGSGVGNTRFALTREELGVPVLAVGVPTIIRASALAEDLHSEADAERLGNLLVTPKDIDATAAELAKIIGYGVSVALQEGLEVEDVELFLG